MNYLNNKIKLQNNIIHLNLNKLFRKKALKIKKMSNFHKEMPKNKNIKKINSKNKNQKILKTLINKARNF